MPGGAFDAFVHSYYAKPILAIDKQTNLFLIETQSADASGIVNAGSAWDVYIYTEPQAWKCQYTGSGDPECGPDMDQILRYQPDYSLYFESGTLDSTDAAAAAKLSPPLKMQLLAPKALRDLYGIDSPDETWVVQSGAASAVIDALRRDMRS